MKITIKTPDTPTVHIGNRNQLFSSGQVGGNLSAEGLAEMRAIAKAISADVNKVAKLTKLNIKISEELPKRGEG